MGERLLSMYLDVSIDKLEKSFKDTHYGLCDSIANGPADWIQKEIRDSLAMAECILPKTKMDEFRKPIGEQVKKDVEKALNMVGTAATTKEKEVFNYIDTDIANAKWLEKRLKIEKENNMFNNSQFYFDHIKDHLQVTNMSVTDSNGSWSNPEIRVDGFVPTDIFHNLSNTNKKEYDKMYKNAPKMPKPTGIIRRDNTTRVDWDDKTYTIIVLEEGQADLDMFHTFCIAFTKKMLGGTTNIMKAIEENDTDKINRERAEAIEKANKEVAEETKKLKAKIEKAEFEAAVKREMFDRKVREEAIRRIMLKEGADIRKTEKIIDRFVKE